MKETRRDRTRRYGEVVRIIRKIQIFGHMEDKSTWNVTKIVAKVLLEHLTQEGNRSVLEVITKLVQEEAEEQRKDARQEKTNKVHAFFSGTRTKRRT